MMQVDGKVTTLYQTTAEKFNHYYIFVADNIANIKSINNIPDNSNKINLVNYLYSAFKQSFTNMTVKKKTTTYEIEKIIKELKSKKVMWIWWDNSENLKN